MTMASPSSNLTVTYLDLHEMCIVLLKLAHARGGTLPQSSPWQLDPMVDYAMSLKGYAPPEGGWAACMSLLAATGIFVCTTEGFEARMSVHTFRERFEHPADVQVAMLEAWTCALMPPHLAAGLCLVLGVHPSWTLKLAGSVHTRFVDEEGAHMVGNLAHKVDHFDDPLIVLWGRLCFELISGIISEIETLSVCTHISIDLLTDLIWEHVQDTHQSVCALDAHVPLGEVGLCMPEAAHLVTRERCRGWIEDLIRDVLVPSRVLSMISPTTLSMHHEVLINRTIRVFECPTAH